MVKFWQSADPKKMDLQVSFARIYLLVEKNSTKNFTQQVIMPVQRPVMLKKDKQWRDILKL